MWMGWVTPWVTAAQGPGCLKTTVLYVDSWRISVFIWGSKKLGHSPEDLKENLFIGKQNTE